MNKNKAVRKNLWSALLVIFLVLLVDQIIKFVVKLNMHLGEEIHFLGNWGIIHFTENNGMAFGMQFSEGNWGKFALSIFRIIAVIGIGYYIYYLIKRNASKGLIFTMSLIFAGALGNIIDSVFYGLLFSDSTYQVATFLPDGGGYGKLLHGKVVDMFYFPIIQGYYPSWFPYLANQEFIFFRPVFNLADSAITVGVISLLIFQRRFFGEEKNKDIKNKLSEDTTTNSSISE